MPIYSKIVKQEQIMLFSKICTTSRLLLENSLTIPNFKKLPDIFNWWIVSYPFKNMFSRILCPIFETFSHDAMTCKERPHLALHGCAKSGTTPIFLPPFTFRNLLQPMLWFSSGTTLMKLKELWAYPSRGNRSDYTILRPSWFQPSISAQCRRVSNIVQKHFGKHQPCKSTHNLMNLFSVNCSSLNSKFF